MPGRGRGRLAGGRRGHASASCSEGRADGVAGRAERRARRCSGPDATESADEPAGGAAYPWDVTAAGDRRSTALKLTCVLSGLARRAGGRPTTAGVTRARLGRRRCPVRRARARHAARRRAHGARRGCATRARDHGGSAVVVDAPAAVKAAVDVWGPVPALDLMRRVKDQFDPDHRLAPGRFVGGI